MHNHDRHPDCLETHYPWTRAIGTDATGVYLHWIDLAGITIHRRKGFTTPEGWIPPR